MYEILTKKTLSSSTKQYLIKAPLIAKKAQPGQFVILRVDEHGERIPLTIADYDRDAGTITIIFSEVGRTTLDLGKLEVGDSLEDLVGPLGQPTELVSSGHVVCVGGGVGIAPLYPKTKVLYDGGARVTTILGARSADLLILEEEMRNKSHKVIITTDDGSKGQKGLVTEPLLALIKSGEKIDEVIAVGPPIMMMKVCELTKEYGIKTLVSLDSLMVDGTGMCGACRVTVGGEMKFTCVDGPVFDGHQVDFEELMLRKKMYQKEENTALEAGRGGCKCHGE